MCGGHIEHKHDVTERYDSVAGRADDASLQPKLIEVIYAHNIQQSQNIATQWYSAQNQLSGRPDQ